MRIPLRLPFLKLKPRGAQRYKVLVRKGPFEVRQYPRSFKAKLSVDGNLDEAFAEGLGALRQYLAGGNLKVRKFPLTPPVLQIPKKDGWELDVFLPATLDPTTAPKPINRFIKFEVIPARKVAVLRGRGKLSEEAFHRRSLELEAFLREHNLRSGSVLRVAHFTRRPRLPFLPKNEVQIDLT